MARWTLLEHETPDGGRHLDLLLAPDDAADPAGRPDDRVLIAFRIAAPLDPPITAPTPIVRTPDHRAMYLDYEGPISGNRGTVRRVDAGSWDPTAITPNLIDGVLDGMGGRWRLTAERAGGPDGWRLTLIPAD